jgi:hypothetical protein
MMDDVLDWIGEQLLRAEHQPIPHRSTPRRFSPRLPRWAGRHATINAIAAVLAATAAFAAVADAAGVIRISALWQQEPNVPSPEGMATQTPPGLASSYAILRAPRNPAIDALPDNSNGVGAIAVPGGGGGHYGVNPALSRFVGTINGQSFWLIPGNLGSCVDTTSDGSICTSNENITTQGAVGWVGDVLGVVPDGATVTATSSDGSPAPVLRSANAFVVPHGSLLRTVTVRETSGHDWTLNMPSGTGRTRTPAQAGTTGPTGVSVGG